MTYANFCQQHHILLKMKGEPDVKQNDEESQDNVINLSNFFKNDRKQLLHKRYLLHTRKQAKGECFDHFYKNIKFLAESCHFNDDSILRDHIVFGLKDSSIRDQLLEYDDPNLQSVVEICRSREKSRNTVDEVHVKKEEGQRSVDEAGSQKQLNFEDYLSRDDESSHHDYTEVPVELKLVKIEPTDLRPVGSNTAGPANNPVAGKSKKGTRLDMKAKKEKPPKIKKKMGRPIKIDKTKPIYKCKICNKILASSGSLSTHKLTHTGERRHKCHICNNAFAIPGTLKQHMAIHTDEKPHVCPICHKAFRQNSHMRSHIATHITKESVDLKKQRQSELGTNLINEVKKKYKIVVKPPLSCNICQKTYTARSSLRDHMIMHSGQRAHQCHICSKQFSQRGSLNIHLCSHADVKPHRCPYCPKSFSTKEYLKKHSLIHTGEMPFTCDQCGKKFRHKSNLNAHMRLHKPIIGESHECETCGKTYPTKLSWVRHQLCHSKPHKCDICLKDFARKNKLTKHMLTHLH